MYVEEAEWAIEVMKATGKPVAMCLNICSAGDFEGVSVEECAVRIAKAGERWNFCCFFLLSFFSFSSFSSIRYSCAFEVARFFQKVPPKRSVSQYTLLLYLQAKWMSISLAVPCFNSIVGLF